MKKYILIIGLFILAITLTIVFSSDENSISGKLYISEVVSNNADVLLDNYNLNSDYIELYNGYNHDINLDGYYLSDSQYEPKKFRIEGLTIKKGEYLIIYASGKNICDSSLNTCHTNFKLSSKGENLLLMDPAGNIINKVVIPALDIDMSYSYNGKKYVITVASPNKENPDKENSDGKSENYNIKVNEYMTHNRQGVYDSHGNYFDWVELKSNEKKDITLHNYYLSDDENSLNKYLIPDTEIKAGGYLIIYLGGDESYEEGIYANFKLSDNDKYIILSNTNKVIDKVDIVVLNDNVSYGLKDSKWQYFPTPTPGKENTGKSFEKWGS